MNILQISEYLKGVPKDFLVKEATLPSGNYPQYLVVSELSRRTAMEKQFAGINAQQNQPQETVAERTVREATPMPMAAMQGVKSPQTTYQEEPSGQETMGVPAAVRMFEGGRVAFQGGGDTIYDRAMSGIKSTFGRFKQGFDRFTNLEEAEAYVNELKQKALSGEEDPRVVERMIGEFEPILNTLRTKSQKEGIRSGLDELGVERQFFKSVPGEIDQRIEQLELMKNYSTDETQKAEFQKQIEELTSKKAEYGEVSQTPLGRAFTGDEGSVTEEVAKDQANRAGETTPPETKKPEVQKPKGEPKEKAPKFNFEEFAASKLTTDYKQIEKDILDRFPKLGEDKTLGGYMQEIKDLREVDYTEKMKGLIDGIEDEARQAELQAVPNALIALGIGIASGDPGQGLLGGFVNGAAKALGVFQDQKKEAREIRRMKREAMGNLYSMMDAQQRGDMQEARRLKEAYQTRKDNLAVAEADLGFKIATLAADDNKTRLVATLNNKAQEVQNAFTAAIKKYEIETNKGIAETKAAQDAVNTFRAMKLEVLKLENQPELFVDVPEDQRNIILNKYKEYLDDMNKSLFIQLGLPVPEGMKKGGITKLDRNPKSLFDFHREE